MNATLPHEFFAAACRAFGETLKTAGADDWSNPTPCVDWDVRDLTHHLVYENVWIPPLLGGATVAEVGDQFEGDLLGSDPVTAWTASATRAIEAVESLSELDQAVHLSYGDEPAAQYLNQLSTDYVIHRWDLAVGLGQDPTMDPDMVEVVAAWFEGQHQMYLDAGVIDPPVELAADADSQAQLLAKFGRASR